MADQEPKDYIRPFTREEVAGKTLQELAADLRPNPYSLVGYAASLQPSIVKAILDGFREEGRGAEALGLHRQIVDMRTRPIVIDPHQPPPRQITITFDVEYRTAPMLLDPMTNNDPRFAIEIEEVAEVRPGMYDVEVSE